MAIWNRGFTLTWLGHSAFELVTRSGAVVLLDPWLSENPMCPEDRRQPARADVIALSHAHGDHAGDAVALAARCGCPVVCGFEVGEHLMAQGVGDARGMACGGTQTVAGVGFTMVPAVHSSSFDEPGRPDGGSEAGYILTLEDDTRLYFAGDTGPTMEFVMIRELYAPEIALLPIGDHYTMGPREAAWAAETLGVRWVVPMHYATFPPLVGRPEGLREALRARGHACEVVSPAPGEVLR